MGKPKTIAEAEGIEDKEMEGLSDIERAALMEDPDAEEAALKQIAGEAEEEEEGEADDKGKKEAKAEAGDKGKKADAKDEGDEDEEEEEGSDDEEEEEDEESKDAGKDTEGEEEKAPLQADDDDEPEAYIPRLKVEPVEDYDKKMADLAAKKNAVHKKFKDGDLELDQMLSERDAIDAEAATLRQQQHDAEVAAKMNEQAEAQAWRHDITTFIATTKKAEGIDYNKKTLNAALDEAVKELANAKDKDGKLVHAGKSGRWFLREAHKQVKADLGLKGAAPGASAEDKEAAEKKAAALKGRKPDLKRVPKTLAGIPGASADDTKGDPEFQHLEKLDGMELEYAVAKMTEEQRERWARSQH